jgi:hypothetical protein
MSRCRFVQPKVVRLPLTDGESVDVKRELSYGEQTAMFARMRTQFSAGAVPQLDTTQIGRARMGAYLVGWSFVDAEGTPVPVSPAAIDNLDIDTARELGAALEAHEEAIAEEKKQLIATASGTSS